MEYHGKRKWLEPRQLAFACRPCPSGRHIIQKGIRPPQSVAAKHAWYESEANHLLCEGRAVAGNDLTAYFKDAMTNHHAMVAAQRATAIAKDPNASFAEHIARLRDTI